MSNADKEGGGSSDADGPQILLQKDWDFLKFIVSARIRGGGGPNADLLRTRGLIFRDFV